MKLKKSFRIPLGFLFGFIYMWRAEPTIVSFLAGAILMVLGVLIRFISSGSLKKFEGVSRSGIYAYTRNPLYIGSFILGIGACIMGKDPYFTALFTVSFPLYYARVIKREEKWLIGMYGEPYEAYIREVPRLIPRHFSLRKILAETETARAIKNYDHHAIYGVIAVWIIIGLKMFFL
ncbi:hypothetical protein ES708_28122 [subsurface metagenome]